jgi:CheY-like chemotaxis protein
MSMVMIVEDNPGMREVIKSSLSGSLFDFCECSDGSEALAMYASHRPDWVLMDIRMKAVDGIRATREITKAFPGAKIVIVTNYNDAALRRDAAAAGAVGFVLKDDLTMLRSILHASRHRQATDKGGYV